MKSISAVLCFCSITMGLPLLGLTQETDETVEMEQLVVTATRTEVPVEQSASSITVIDREAIEEKHLRTVLEALREVPGLDIVQTGGPGGTTSAFLRGGNSSHTLVLIDGVPVNSPTTGAFDFADLTTQNIERIEIVRGPQSTLYGSDAIGGVIQVFTRKGQGATTSSVTFEAGSFQTFRETMGVSGSSERIDYSFSAARSDSNGFSRANEQAGNSEKDGYENTTFSSRVGVQLMAGAHLEWTVRFTDAETELDGCDPVTFFCPVDDPNFVQDSQALVSSLSLAASIIKNWDQQLKLSLNLDELKGTDPDASFNNYKIDTQGRRLDWQHNFSLGELDRITIGYEYESQRGESKGNFAETLINNAGYALNQLRLEPFVFNLGVRLDDNNRFGTEVTYKAEAAYLMDNTGTKIRAAYGTGFHGPTLNDLFFPGFGNPDLQPENSRSVEAGIEQQFWGGAAKLGATYFYSRFDDLIVFVFDPVTFTGMPENVQRAKVTGTMVEFDAHPIEAVTVSANYTFTDTENENTGAELARRPKHKANGTVTILPINGLRLNLDLRYVGKRFSDTGNTIPLKDYIVVNLAGTYDINANTAVFAKVENLFDRDYEEVAGYGTAGLSAYGGMKVTF